MVLVDPDQTSAVSFFPPLGPHSDENPKEAYDKCLGG
jgi:hypothetical protein